jgi:hypothetical protein
LLSKNIKIKIYRNIVLPLVLYGWKTWSLTSREERRPRVFENGEIRVVMAKHEPITPRICGQTFFVERSAGFALHRMRLISLRTDYVTIATGT